MSCQPLKNTRQGLVTTAMRIMTSSLLRSKHVIYFLFWTVEGGGSSVGLIQINRRRVPDIFFAYPLQATGHEPEREAEWTPVVRKKRGRKMACAAPESTTPVVDKAIEAAEKALTAGQRALIAKRAEEAVVARNPVPARGHLGSREKPSIPANGEPLASKMKRSTWKHSGRCLRTSMPSRTDAATLANPGRTSLRKRRRTKSRARAHCLGGRFHHTRVPARRPGNRRRATYAQRRLSTLRATLG